MTTTDDDSELARRAGTTDERSQPDPEQIRLAKLAELSAELEAEFGPIPDEIREQTRRTWPDFEEAE